MGNYNWAFKMLNAEKINSAFEVGSRDGIDSVEIFNAFNCHVGCFEPNPQQWNEIEKNINHLEKVKLIKLGIMTKNGTMSFFQVVNDDKNVGASSFLNVDYSWRPEDLGTAQERKEIVVETIRLDTYLAKENLEKVDLLCIDVEGAELEVIRSLGEYLQKSYSLIIETSWNKPMFEGGGNFSRLMELLGKDFIPVSARSIRGNFSDVLFINKKHATIMNYLNFFMMIAKVKSLFLLRKFKKTLKS